MGLPHPSAIQMPVNDAELSACAMSCDTRLPWHRPAQRRGEPHCI